MPRNQSQDAFFRAVIDGDASTVERLLDENIGGKSGGKGDILIDRKDQDGRTALISAVIHGHFDVAKLLLDRGADFLLGASRRSGGLSPFLLAACYSRVAIAELLLQRGENVNQTSVNGATALYFAAHHGHLSFAEFLIRNGARVDLNCEASLRGHFEIVKLVLENGADVKYNNGNGQNALFLAAYGGHLAIAELLVENGADMNHLDRYDRSPLSFAQAGGSRSQAVVDFLASHSAVLGRRTPHPFFSINN